MRKDSILVGVVGLIIGLAIGFFVANSLNKSAISEQTIAQNQSNIPGVNPQQNPPANAPVTQNAGMQADVQKRLDKATNNPNDYEAQIDAGRMYAQIQRFDKALEFFRNAQKLKPDDFDSNSLLGNAYFDDRQFNKAQKFYEKALDIKPNDVTVRSDYATTFFQQNAPDYERAIKEFEQALAIDEKHEPTYYNLGITYLRMNNKENAQKTLERLKEAAPNSSLVKKLEDVLNKK